MYTLYVAGYCKQHCPVAMDQFQVLDEVFGGNMALQTMDNTHIAQTQQVAIKQSDDNNQDALYL